MRKFIFELLPVLLIGFTIGKFYFAKDESKTLVPPNQEAIFNLQVKSDSLEATLETERNLYDKEILKLEAIISEYEWGVEYLEVYHRPAYKDFIRVVQYKENYTKRDEIEFKERADLDNNRYKRPIPKMKYDEHNRF